MKIELGKKYLVTTDNWFVAPDGQSYKAVFGTAKAIENDTDSLGIKTNARSTNWYLLLGNMLVAGCQIHYVIQTDSIEQETMTRDVEFEGALKPANEAVSRIYEADEERLTR